MEGCGLGQLHQERGRHRGARSGVGRGEQCVGVIIQRWSYPPLSVGSDSLMSAGRSLRVYLNVNTPESVMNSARAAIYALGGSQEFQEG